MSRLQEENAQEPGTLKIVKNGEDSYSMSYATIEKIYMWTGLTKEKMEATVRSLGEQFGGFESIDIKEYLQ